jgi:23S rRNA (adenine2503-C2)-methyltransferase
MKKEDIKNLTPQDLKKRLLDLKEASYRADQILSWLYVKNVKSFAQMSNLSPELQKKLTSSFYIGELELAERFISNDGTQKFLFKLEDGNFIETVLIKATGRETVCVSTQAGCKFACRFCASGKKGFIRNLKPAEITGQVIFLKNKLNFHVTNVVFMGMGEPLDNYLNTVKAIRIINDEKCLNIAARRITVSTCGITPQIKKLINLKLQINLSISLHATNEKLRSRLMPVNKKYPLKGLLAEVENYFKATNRKITLEYILIKAVNDSKKDAENLAAIAHRLRATINLIRYHEIAGQNFRAPDKEGVDKFMKYLRELNANVTLRVSKGTDISGACGQLAGRK